MEAVTCSYCKPRASPIVQVSLPVDAYPSILSHELPWDWHRLAVGSVHHPSWGCASFGCLVGDNIYCTFCACLNDCTLWNTCKNSLDLDVLGPFLATWPWNIAIISMIARPFPGVRAVRATGAAVCMRKGPSKVPESFQQLSPVSQPWKHQPYQFCKCEFQRLIINASRAKSPRCQKIATTSPSFLGTLPFLGGGNLRI